MSQYTPSAINPRKRRNPRFSAFVNTVGIDLPPRGDDCRSRSAEFSMRVMLAEAGVRGDGGGGDNDGDNDDEIHPSTQKSHVIWSP